MLLNHDYLRIYVYTHTYVSIETQQTTSTITLKPTLTPTHLINGDLFDRGVSTDTWNAIAPLAECSRGGVLILLC